MEYRQRIADKLLKNKLMGMGAVLVEGAKSLQRLARKIDTTKMKAPSFLMVLTATGKYAFRRADGVWVVPIGTLKE